MSKLLATTAIAALLAGCAGMVGLDAAAPIPVAEVGAPAGFPECQADAFDFAGRGTLRGLGLHEATPVPPPDIDRVGMIWVTHDLMPHDFGPPGGPVAMTRMLCFEFTDGSGGSGWPVDPTWRPPRSAGAPSDNATDSGLPPSMLAAAVVLLVASAVSVLAFRRAH
jgi:hypothetical protein